MWRDELLGFLGEIDHPAWGRSHSRRVLETSLRLAEAEELFVDEDVLFAAAYLHDVGAVDPYRREGVDHSERSAGVAPVVLEQVSFDPERMAMVVGRSSSISATRRLGSCSIPRRTMTSRSAGRNLSMHS